MGKKKKSKVKQTISSHCQEAGVKRKPIIEEAPPAKRIKRKKDDNWYPGKFVLLKSPQSEKQNGNSYVSFEASASTDSTKQDIYVSDRKNRQQSDMSMDISEINPNIEGNMKSSGLKHIYDDNLNSSSDDDDWMDLEQDDDFESMSEDKEENEELCSDIDDSEDSSLDDDEYSFHESDCESIGSSADDESPCDKDYWNDSSDDSDYLPDIEDRYIKPGEAIIYNAKGLDLAFGNSSESQIIEINDISPAIMEKGRDDEVPELISPGTAVEIEESIAQISSSENLVEDLQIEYDEECEIACTRIGEGAKFYNCIQEKGVVVKLSSTIHFHGILIIKALANNVQVNGYTLKPEEILKVMSISRADYLLNLTPVIEASSEKKLKVELENLLSDDILQNVMDNFKPECEALIHLQHGLPSPTLQILKAYSSHQLLPSKKMILRNSPCVNSELILSTKFLVAHENKKINTFQLNDQWLNLEVETKTRIVVVGGKNVGKSGLSQFLINNNVKHFGKILLIDLDIGQPICSSPQTVSATLIDKPIIGPGFLIQNPSTKCFLFGDKSVMIAPFKYVRCVRRLLEFCGENKNFQNIPWVINTMGYQKGFGLQLICLLLRIIQPTDVVQVQHGIKSYNFAKIITEQIVNEFEFSFFDTNDLIGIRAHTHFITHVLDSIVNNQESDLGSKWISNASDKRKLSMLAQLAKLMKDNHSNLNDVAPFVAPIEKVRILVMDEEYGNQKQDININLLNGNLVYLCNAFNESLDSNSVLECHGIGVVRGIDKINEKIYILLPQSDNMCQLQAKINVLAIANVPLPAEILLKQSLNISNKNILRHVTFFKDRSTSSKKYVNKRNIKDVY